MKNPQKIPKMTHLKPVPCVNALSHNSHLNKRSKLLFSQRSKAPAAPPEKSSDPSARSFGSWIPENRFRIWKNSMKK